MEKQKVLKTLGNARVHINIPLSHFQNILSWDKIFVDNLVEKAIEVAVKVGLRLDEEGAEIYLKEAEKKGTGIDWNNRAAVFTRRDIEETIYVMQKTAPLPKPVRQLAIREERPEKFFVGNGANLVFDWELWQAKPPTKQDLTRLCRWAQGNDDVGELDQAVMLKDLDLNLEPLYSFALMARICRKKVYANQATEPVHIKYLPKMFAAVERHRGYLQQMAIWEYVNPPFRMSLRAIRTMLARVDLGVCKEMGIGTMAVSGMSAPVTVAGLAITALAEILAGLTFFRILRPGFGLRPNVCTGSIDLKTARVGYFGMHTHLCNLATWELLTRGLKVDSAYLTWYRDANEPGMQALYEFGLAQAFFSSVLYRTYPEIGGLACGNIFSPEQAILDMEAVKEFNEMAFGFEVDEETFGIEEILKARFEQGYHMSTEHTVRHLKDGIPFSDFFFRGLPGGANHKKDPNQTRELLEKAAEKVRTDIEKGESAEPDEELAKELYEIVKEASAELKIETPPLP